MKKSDYFALLAAVWLAPYMPDVTNVIFGGVALAIGIGYAYKEYNAS